MNRKARNKHAKRQVPSSPLARLRKKLKSWGIDDFEDVFELFMIPVSLTVFLSIPVILVVGLLWLIDVRPTDLGFAPGLEQAGETPPPIGEEVFLNAREVAYCVNEKQRMGFLRETATDPAVIGFLAEAVDDYNLRCSHYLANPADLQLAKDDAAANIHRFKAQAEAVLEDWFELAGAGQ